MHLLALIAIGAATLCLLFQGVYLIAKRINNYSIVDIAWSYAFGLITVGYAVASDGWWARRVVLTLLVEIWSVRLGSYLWIRISHHHPVEDARYEKLRQDWGERFALKMCGFFQLQAFSVVLLALPFLFIAANPSRGFNPLEIAAMILWAIAVCGEAVADAQLSSFKRATGDTKRVCDVGLWRFSRHPNYFFEWVIWVSYSLFALTAPWGLLGLISPACILWLLLRVTGIPMAEAQSLRTKGNAFRQYQRTTSAFIPWPPRKQNPTNSPEP